MGALDEALHKALGFPNSRSSRPSTALPPAPSKLFPPSSAPTMPSPIKLGLMGYGSSTKIFHLPYILPNPDLEVVAFLQRAEAPRDKATVEPGKHCTVDYPKAKHYRTTEDFLGDGEIELVVVCTSSATHFELGKAALEAGKHVVIEKPFTVTSAEADTLIALAKEKNRILTVYQNRRYDSDFRTLKHLMSLNPNPFGKVTEFANSYDLDAPEWVRGWVAEEGEPGEGMLYGLGTHSLDQTLQLFGRPASVTAFTRVLRDPAIPRGADDAFTVVLQYGGAQRELLCTVKTTIVSPMPLARQPKFLVRGTQGSFAKPGEDVQADHFFAGRKADDPGFGIEPERYHGYLHTRKPVSSPSLAQCGDQSESGQRGIEFSGTVPSQPGSWMDYYRDVVKAVRGEGPVVVKPEESRMGIRVIELARQSVQERRTVEWSER